MCARRFTSLDQIERRIAAGYGQGEGAEYKPWLLARDISSPGRSHIVPSTLFKRAHEVPSDFMYEWLVIALYGTQTQQTPHAIKDIRETYPIPLTSSLKIAQVLGVKHPVEKKSPIPRTITTSFLVTLGDESGAKRVVARSVYSLKDFDAQKRTRLFALLEITRVHWALQGIQWKLVTRDQVSQLLSDTLTAFVEATKQHEVVNDLEGQAAFLTAAARRNWVAVPVNETVRRIAETIDRTAEHSMNLFKLLAWRGNIHWNIRKVAFHPSEPLPEQPTFRALTPQPER